MFRETLPIWLDRKSEEWLLLLREHRICRFLDGCQTLWSQVVHTDYHYFARGTLLLNCSALQKQVSDIVMSQCHYYIEKIRHKMLVCQNFVLTSIIDKTRTSFRDKVSCSRLLHHSLTSLKQEWSPYANNPERAVTCSHQLSQTTKKWKQEWKRKLEVVKF